MHRQSALQFTVTVGLLTAGFSLGRMLPFAPTAPQDPLRVARAMSSAYQTISRRIAPSVVQIKAYSEWRGGRLRSRQDGSGVLVGPDGVIVTNYHVVRDADVLRVVFIDGSSMEASIVGTDQETDLAVLRVLGEGPFAHTTLDDVDPAIGEIVLAMGNPMGLGHSVTQGIVSGTGRTDLNIAAYEDFIQTDAVINPGNSGGPLIDLDGRVVGINTAVGLASNGDDGIAFAIPCRIVRKVLGDILREGHVVRGWLGVEMSNRRFALQSDRARGYDGISRVKVIAFEPESPAREAGIETGDIVLRIAGRRVVTQQDLMNIIAETRPGVTVDVEVWREGEVLTVPVELSERE